MSGEAAEKFSQYFAAVGPVGLMRAEDEEFAFSGLIAGFTLFILVGVENLISGHQSHGHGHGVADGYHEEAVATCVLRYMRRLVVKRTFFIFFSLFLSCYSSRTAVRPAAIDGQSEHGTSWAENAEPHRVVDISKPGQVFVLGIRRLTFHSALFKMVV